MIGMLRGHVESVDAVSAIIEVGGVGYEVRMPSADLASMHAGSIDLSQIEGSSATASTPEDTGAEQVVEGLMSLGWHQQDAVHAVQTVCADNQIETPLNAEDVPRVLKLELTQLDRER